MLEPYRVLDLTDERGQLAGFMLAQLGAEVIAVEPPGGSRSRRLGPFVGDVEGPETSLRHLAYNRGKASIELDLNDVHDREAFLELVRGADVLLECDEVGAMASRGLGYAELAEVNPALVYTSLSPFGQTGPKADWAATDLTIWASAGPATLTGDSDRAPLRMQVDQAWAHAASEGAGASVVALIERARSGQGQHVDISAQQTSTNATQSNVLAAPNGDTPMTREAGGLRFGDIFIQLLWPCADGFVSVTFLFGTALGVATDRLMQVILDEGFCDQATRDKDWLAYGEMVFSGTEPLSEYNRVKDCVGAFCMAHTKAELLELATTKRLLIAPVNLISDVVELDHFDEREFWDTIDGVRYPGPFAKVSETPLHRLPPAPSSGADTSRLLAEPTRQPANDTPPTSDSATGRPLEGLKVLDFMWVMAGPAGTRVLTDLGATVVRVESAAKVDTARTLQPFRNGENSLESSTLFANMNAGKLGMSVNPATEEGRAVIEDLIRWADVVTESFSPKAMRNWGLDYESIHKINPRVVMLSSCLFGQTGPLSMFAGYGTMAAAMTGFFGITGWPDRPPSGPFGAYTDYISPRFANATLLAAIDHQRRTGIGQYIDFAQAEGSLHAIAPLVLDYTVNDRVASTVGNTDPLHHPHGVFAVAGTDKWIALACTNDAERAALTNLTGGLDDAAIEQWTRSLDGPEVEGALQAAGVPSHLVADSVSMMNDPQLQHRGHYATVPHASLGEIVVEGPKSSFSRTPGNAGSPPTLGQHTTEVLTDILGYGDDRMVELLISGALE